MASNYLVLGQVAPSATTNTTLYTVPASTQTIVSTIMVCERGGSNETFRIAVRPDGAAISDQHYIVYDAPVLANDIVGLTLGITLGDTDVITVFGSASTISFSAFGSEVTA